MKLFSKAGGSGNQQDVVSGAVSTIMKFVVQSKLTTGGGNSGGLGKLMNMVSHFWGLRDGTKEATGFTVLEVGLTMYLRTEAISTY